MHYVRYFSIIALSILFLMSNSFANNSGYSIINVSTQAIPLFSGRTSIVNYTVNLSSGTGFLTYLKVNNAGALAADGINISFSNESGQPPFYGKMYISALKDAKPGVYTANISASGSDPSISTLQIYMALLPMNITNTTTISENQNLSEFIVMDNQTLSINANNGAMLSVGGIVNLNIPPGTYVNINGYKYANYNVSLFWFKTKYLNGPNANYPNPDGAFGIAVNGQIDPSISFITSTNTTAHLVTTIINGKNNTSWTYLGGGWYKNNSYYGGGYNNQDNWSVNNSNIFNVQFSTPLIHVLFPISNTNANYNTTIPTIPTTIATTSIPAFTNQTNKSIAQVINSSTIVSGFSTIPTNYTTVPSSNGSGYNVSKYNKQPNNTYADFAIIAIVLVIGIAFIIYLKMRK